MLVPWRFVVFALLTIFAILSTVESKANPNPKPLPDPGVDVPCRSGRPSFRCRKYVRTSSGLGKQWYSRWYNRNGSGGIFAGPSRRLREPRILLRRRSRILLKRGSTSRPDHQQRM